MAARVPLLPRAGGLLTLLTSCISSGAWLCKLVPSSSGAGVGQRASRGSLSLGRARPGCQRHRQAHLCGARPRAQPAQPLPLLRFSQQHWEVGRVGLLSHFTHEETDCVSHQGGIEPGGQVSSNLQPGLVMHGKQRQMAPRSKIRREKMPQLRNSEKDL